MKTLKNKKSGFTLIELLVVIAVIAILATIVVPAVTSTLLNSKWTKMQSNGRNMFIMVFDASLNGGGEFPKSTDYGGKTSTEFFYDLGTNKVFNTSYDFLAGPGTEELKKAANVVNGTPQLSSSEFQAKHNAWNVVLDLTEGSEAGTPFLISRNYDNATLAANNSGSIQSFLAADTPWDDTRSMNGGTERVAIVLHGGGGQVLKGNKLTGKFLNPVDFGKTVGGGDADVIQP